MFIIDSKNNRIYLVIVFTNIIKLKKIKNIKLKKIKKNEKAMPSVNYVAFTHPG